MTTQQKNNIRYFLNPVTITNTIIGGIILFFLQSGFKENKDSIIQSEKQLATINKNFPFYTP